MNIDWNIANAIGCWTSGIATIILIIACFLIIFISYKLYKVKKEYNKKYERIKSFYY